MSAVPMNSAPAVGAVIELTQYHSSALASGVVAAFCVLFAWRPATPLNVGAVPARFVAPTTFSINASTVSPADVVADRVIGDVAADVRARMVLPKVCAI